MPELAYDRLHEVLNYDPTTGIFTWKIKTAKCTQIGAVAGCKEKRIGYTTIGVDKCIHRAHRLAWFYMTGKWPVKFIDHINGQKSDNRFENLREVFEDGNSQNIRKPNKRNKSGFMGVIRFQNKWRASVTIQGKTRRIGDYNTPEEAHQAYLKAKREYHVACTI